MCSEKYTTGIFDVVTIFTVKVAIYVYKNYVEIKVEFK